MSRFPSSFGVLVLSAGAGLALGAGPETNSDWMANAQRVIAEREYHASVGEAGLQAPNRAQDLRTHFGPQGIRLADRTSSDGAALVDMRVLGVGRGRKLAPVPAGEVVSDGARVEIRRPGLVEWYENRPEGLEQGFTLARRPSGKGELRVALGLGAARVRRDGDDLVLVSASGRELKYGGLVVRDARGKQVPSRFELPGPAEVEIAVDERNAEYPLLVDPIFAGIFPPFPDQTLSVLDNSFGASVAGNCDVNGDGYADLIVGAPAYDQSAPGEGAVFVFHGGPTGIGGAIKAMLHVGQANAYFGASVACAGKVNHDRFDDIIVGAPKFEESLITLSEGAAFLFKGGAAGVDPYYDSFLHSDQAFAEMGVSVAGAGDVDGDGYDDVIVGAGKYDKLAPDGSILLEDAGAAFVFLGGPSGVASSTPAQANAKLVADQAGAHMGGVRPHWSVARDGAVAGAGDVNADGFDDIIVGAPYYKYGGSAGGIYATGAAFVYFGGRQGIGNEPADATLYGQNASYPVSKHLGWDVAGAGDVNGDGYDDVVVGGEGEWPAVALVFHGGSAGIASGGPDSAASRLTIFNEGFGSVSVASAGDVNNDGYDDLILSSVGDSSLYQLSSRVFLSTANGLPDSPTLPPPTSPENEYALQEWVIYQRSSVAGAGDVNGDGYDDVLLGTTEVFMYGDLGVVRVYHGGPTPGQPVIQREPR